MGSEAVAPWPSRPVAHERRSNTKASGPKPRKRSCCADMLEHAGSGANRTPTAGWAAAARLAQAGRKRLSVKRRSLEARIRSLDHLLHVLVVLVGEQTDNRLALLHCCRQRFGIRRRRRHLTTLLGHLVPCKARCGLPAASRARLLTNQLTVPARCELLLLSLLGRFLRARKQTPKCVLSLRRLRVLVCADLEGQCLRFP